MTEPHWLAVDRYITDLLVPRDEVLEAVLTSAEAAGLPPIGVAPNQGKLLMLLAQLLSARNILEIGTLAGYSAIWLARALPADGRLITLEADPLHAQLARANFARAGFAEVIELRLGQALETLPQLLAEGRGPFDLIFIDADKQHSADYFIWSLKLARRGSLIVIDNVVRDGAIVHEASTNPDIAGIRRLYATMAAEAGVSATAIQTVGSKGHDGLAFAVVTAHSEHVVTPAGSPTTARTRPPPA